MSEDGAVNLSHIDEQGRAQMVDVSAKAQTKRVALATGTVRTTREVIELISSCGLPKGEALQVARVAGIMGAKRTPELIPLCHTLLLSGVEVEFELAESAVHISARVKTSGQTGVEMEALTAVSVAALTVFDMIKAVDKAAVLTDIRVEHKSGGKSGEWVRDERN
ncbi:cyclic pyranopterin monophosphate synthase MoaC [Brevibacterium sp. 50QC2O2]|jgi:cyclic pyranopterin phosphate synthase|uniref:cyclic pyranopterin monophosphate synthase MoaC n=1 Tax=Brevibacterium TaxID=1696 RepID=UPI00211B88DC|nr:MULTISPECIES: cyclic pyranopterin monophosphate synthase MoaC [unclassified Brevibacterium]MCQ9386193.1 cyclic pyranopterin monophosphate synthase MoaC [Brevibacterium sp. 68QC2CO]MCQ9388546.1 cyclic pyranopterin monophosphate synthase MoaC [Brevibacterium sp. 50QC2O2]